MLSAQLALCILHVLAVGVTGWLLSFSGAVIVMLMICADWDR
jgi:hypothetical protein